MHDTADSVAAWPLAQRVQFRHQRGQHGSRIQQVHRNEVLRGQDLPLLQIVVHPIAEQPARVWPAGAPSRDDTCLACPARRRCLANEAQPGREVETG